MAVYEGQDHSFNSFGDEFNCLYYYFLNKDVSIDSTYLGFVPTIQTVCYNPFIEMEDFMLVKSPFNVDKYGHPDEDTGYIPSVYRITDNEDIEKTLYDEELQQTVSSDEPILNYYPYRYLMLYDGFNQPLIIKPQYLRNKMVRIEVKTNVNQNGKYLLYVYGYKGDFNGNLEGIVNDVPLLVPVTSSAYSQFWATSSAQFNQSFINTSIENQTRYNHNIQNMELQYNQTNANNMISGMTNGLNSLLNAFTLNFGGAINGFGGLLNNVSTAYFKQKGYDLGQNQAEEIKANSDYYNEASRMATLKDFKKSPRAVTSLGSDIAFSKMKNLYGIQLYDVSLQPDVIRKLKNFYQKYGYPVNKYMDNYKIGQIRENFNFVKMGYCNVFSDKIPKADLDIIRTIFESGVTFWNVENGLRIGDYSVTNNERG